MNPAKFITNAVEEAYYRLRCLEYWVLEGPVEDVAIVASMIVLIAIGLAYAFLR